MSRKIKNRILLCGPVGNEKESALNNGNGMVESRKRKRCCLFDDPGSTKDSFLLWLEDLETNDDSEDRFGKIFRCTRCGSYVQYVHEEIHCYWQGFNWDNLDIYDHFYPVYEKQGENGAITYENAGDGVTFFDHYHDRS